MIRSRKLGFYLERMVKEKKFLPTHFSLFLAIYTLWEFNKFNEKFKISRKELMRLSRIASTATYHKCIKDLELFGFIKYEPSFNYFKGSQMRIIDLKSYKKC